MKRCVVAGLACLLGGTSAAFAADLPVPPPQGPVTYVPAPVPVYNWQGVYIGINGGYGFGNSNWGPDVGTGNFKVDGGLVGGTLGANFQYGPWVFGIEGDGDWTDITGSAACGAGAVTCQTSNDWLATIRGRVGYAVDRVLIYGTAGAAVGDIKSSATGFGSTDNTEFGWTAGAGLEFGITENVTAKVEYLFVDLESSNSQVPTAQVSFDTSLICAGLNFKFNLLY
jgi:outer membrane immunogenic protein